MIESAVAIKSDRFGQLTVDSGAFFKFDAPLPGFEKSRNYVLLKFEEFQPFAWLQSTEESHVCLPLVDPWRYFPEYQPRVSAQTMDRLGVSEDGEVAVYCVVAPGESGLTLNLAAPLVLHQDGRCGEQVILEESDYSLAEPMEQAC